MALLVGLVPEGEVAGDHLQQQVVHRVEDVGHASSGEIGDVHIGFDAVDAAHAGGDGGMRRLERRVVSEHGAVLVHNGEEAAVVSGVPVAPGALTLLDDALDCVAGAGDVGDRHQLRPYMGRIGLVEVRPDEQPPLAHPVGQPDDSLFDGPVEVALRGEVLPARLQFVGRHRLGLRSARHEALAVGHVHALGAFEIDEVLQGGVAERQQPQLDPGWVSLGLVRHVRPADVWRRTDGGQQVLDECPVEHLLGRDGEDDRPPALRCFQLLVAEARTRLRAQAESRE